MDPQRWQKIEEIFHAALDLEGNEREQCLDAACVEDESLRTEVEKLIARFEKEDTFLESPVWTDSAALGTDLKRGVADFLAEPTGKPVPSYIGRRVGVYVLTEQIGKGGMGIVFAADRADGEFEQRAAIKLIKKGMDTDFIVGRFRHERQILASLNHPNIARLLDGGTLDGSPYFVMEFIEGEPLLAYSESYDLDLHTRLSLFLDVCRAIAYAHERKIIHRDIKPGNILVSRNGIPKLLDFGIAKILDPDLIHESISPTATAMRLMTPEYASPEQVRGLEITPASDQYSLGALLYELVTGERPYKFSSRAPHEIARVICEEVPTNPTELGTRVAAPRTRRNLVAKDDFGRALDAVVMRSLQKEPALRYVSVEAFVADLERLIKGDTGGFAIPERTVYKPNLITGDNLEARTSVTTAPELTPITGSSSSPVKAISPRWRGVKQGLFAIICTFLFIPVLMILGMTGLLHIGVLAGILFLLISGSLLRIVYALFFESGVPELPPAPDTSETGPTQLLETPLPPLAELPALPAPPVSDQPTEDRSIAVLPFKSLNSGTDANAEFLGFGLADALVMRLSGVKKFVVRPSSSAHRFLDGTDSFAAGRELGVRYLLEGNFIATEKRTRVSVQLLDISQESTIWAERFDEEAGDFLGLEDSISRKVAAMIVPQLTASELKDLAKRGTENEEAHEAYLRGRFHWNSFTQDSLRQAIYFYQKAVELDPNYALAYAGIADYLIWLGIFGALSPDKSFLPAKQMAMKAISIDPDRAEGHAALGLARLCSDYDWIESEASIRRAIEINPNYAIAHNWFALHLFSAGRFDEGIEHAQRAIELDPLTYQNYRTISWGFYFARRFDKAHEAINNVIRKFPMTGTALANRSWLLRAKGDIEQALADSTEAMKTAGGNFFVTIGHAQSLAAAGKITEAEEVIASVETQAPERYVSYYQIAIAYCYARNKEAALAALDRAFRDHEGWLIWLDIEPALDILRTEQRFIELLETVRPYSYKPRSAQPPVQKAIAVMPFTLQIARDYPEGVGEGFLRIGLADALITRLSNVRQLIVRPTSAIAKYDNQEFDSIDAGHDLAVDYLLEGRIFRSGSRFRVSLQMLDVSTGSAAWAERYDHDFINALELEDAVSDWVAASLVPQLTGEERRLLAKRATQSAEAHETYLRGRFHWNSFTEDGFRQAKYFYERAIEIDPDYVLAYAGLTDYYLWLGAYAMLPPRESFPPARAAAEKAVELDPNSAEAHSALGFAILCDFHDWEASERHALRAMELNPNHISTYFWYSSHCLSLERWDEAFRLLEYAVKLDPFAYQAHNSLAYGLYFHRRFDEAIQKARENVARFPGFSLPLNALSNFLRASGRGEESREVALEAMKHASDLDRVITSYGLVSALAAAGESDVAREMLTQIERNAAGRYLAHREYIIVYCYLGEKEKALDALERSYADNELMIWLAIDPAVDPIRNEPRYKAVIDKLFGRHAPRIGRTDRGDTPQAR